MVHRRKFIIKNWKMVDETVRARWYEAKACGYLERGIVSENCEILNF